MERRPGEIPLAVDLGKVRPVQLPYGADHRARRQRRRCSVATTRPNGPGGCGIVPGRLGHLGFPQHMAADVIAVHHGLEVGLQLGLFGEEVRPLIGRLEAVAVEVISDVDPRPRIGVLPPRPADTGVLLDDRERDACLFEANARQQPRFPAADHDHREVVGRGATDRPTVFAVELHLFEQHRHVFGWNRLAHQPLHHLQQQLRADRLRFRTAAGSR